MFKQIDKKALYVSYKNGYTIFKSYDTPIIFIHNNKVYTTDTKYSTTTSKHKNIIMKDFNFKDLQAVNIPQKVFNETMLSLNVSLGIA